MAYEKLRYNRTLTAHRKGIGGQFQMFGGGSTTAGHVALFDSNGDLISGSSPVAGVEMGVGSPYVNDPALFDGSGNLIPGTRQGNTTKLACYGTGSPIFGNVPIFDINGNLIDGGTSPVGGGNNPNAMPTRATMWHDSSLVTVGNAISVVNQPSQNYGTYSVQSTAADGDTFTQSFLLAAGTYTLKVLGYTDNNRGKIDWYIDDTIVVSGQDWYSANGTLNVFKQDGSISVVGNGRHVLKGVVNGKNGSSSGYYICLTNVVLIPGSDVGSV